jgi:hypothetical protein
MGWPMADIAVIARIAEPKNGSGAFEGSMEAKLAAGHPGDAAAAQRVD